MILAPPAAAWARATARDPEATTLGHVPARVSAVLGKPFMPWQRYVADVAHELHPTRPGWRYRIVILTVPRQAGKTTLVHAVNVARAMTRPRSMIFYTAQTGKDARARWTDLAEAVEQSPLHPHTRRRGSVGSEALSWPNGSSVRPFAPTPKSLHGYTPPLVCIDEAWAFDTAAGAALEAAIIPTQQTLEWRQLWIVSTRGDATSAWLDDQIARGRESLTDPGTEVAFFESSADPELAATDPLGDDTLAFHPALGHTVTLDDLRGLAGGMSPGGFKRSILNLPTATAETITDLKHFDTLAETGTGIPERLVLGYAVAEKRTAGAIWAAWHDSASSITHLAHVATQPGAAWMAGALAELQARLNPRAIVANDTPATRTVSETAHTGFGISTALVTARDYAAASTGLLGRITDAELAHDGAPELRDALEVAGLGPVAGGLAVTERASRGSIVALQAAIVAAHHAPTARGIQLW